MHENLERLQPQDQLKRELLLKLPLSSHTIWGHGTLTRKVAVKILDEGISVNQSYSLHEIAVPLTNKDSNHSEKVNNIVQSSMNWKHKDAQYIVLIAVPHGMKIAKVVEDFEVNQKNRTRLPSRFICGFIDVRRMTYEENKNFTPDPKPTDGKKIASYAEIVGSKSMNSDLVTINIPAATAEDDEDIVW